MKKQLLALSLGAMLFALCHAAEAQQPTKVYRVGLLSVGSGLGVSEKMLQRDMRELGYVEGQNVQFEMRFADRKLERMPGQAAELVRLKVDVIVVGNVQGALAAKKATQTIPIVFATAADPVETGLVTSLAQPSGNMTGVTDLARDLAGKRLELLKETFPKVSRVGVLLWNPPGPGYAAERNELESASGALRVQLQFVEVGDPNDLESGFSRMIKRGAKAFIGLTDQRLASNRQRVVELSAKHRLPAMYQDRTFTEAGGLMSYATNRTEWRRRVAYYVDRILKGSKPADLPVEQPKKFEFIINLKAAKEIGLTIPPNVLARADKVIK
jgi:putative ABC transport system substrate-binding protein